MKNIKLQHIFLDNITKFNNFLINKFNQIKILKNKFNRINHLKSKFDKISNFNKFLIFSISSLFLYLFYVSTPSLYDYQRLQNQLKTHLLKEYNLNINISDKIEYKILPYPHFEVKESTIYRKKELKEHKLGELKNLKIFISISNIHNQEKLQLKNIEIKNSIFYLNKVNQKFILNYFKNKNTDRKILIKKSNFFLMNKDKVISIFPIKDLNYRYNKEISTNEVLAKGKAFNSDFNISLKKNFLDDQSLKLNLKFPQINLSIINEHLVQNKNKIFSKINFFGSEIKSELDINEDSLIFKSIKSKIFNSQIDFDGIIEFQPFYLTSQIILDEVNLVKILNNNNEFFRFFDKKNLIHKNFNSKILIDIKKFSKDNIFDYANLFIEFQNGLIKFDNSTFISNKLGSLKILRSNFYTIDNKLFLNSQILIDVKNQKRFYNTLQIPKLYRVNIKKIRVDFVTNITSGTTKIINTQINDIISDNLVKEINKVIEDNNIDIDINKNFNNWIVFKRILNTIISQVN